MGSSCSGFCAELHARPWCVWAARTAAVGMGSCTQTHSSGVRGSGYTVCTRSCSTGQVRPQPASKVRASVLTRLTAGAHTTQLTDRDHHPKRHVFIVHSIHVM